MFLLLFLFEKKTGQNVLFSFLKEMTTKTLADICCLVIGFKSPAYRESNKKNMVVLVKKYGCLDPDQSIH